MRAGVESLQCQVQGEHGGTEVAWEAGVGSQGFKPGECHGQTYDSQ